MLYALPSLIAAAITLCMMLYLWQRRYMLPAKFPLLMGGSLIWTFCSGMKMLSTDLETALFWANLQTIGIVIAPVAWLAFSLWYVGRERWLTKRIWTLLLIEPVVMQTLIWTDGWHHFIRQETYLDTSGPVSQLITQFGPGFWINVAYAYALLLTSVILLVWTIIRSPHRMYRGQAVMLMISLMIPWAGNIIQVMEPNTFRYIEVTPISFVIAKICIIWGIMRYRLFDIVPVARETVLAGLQDGVVALDLQQRIVDLNPAAEKFLGVATQQAMGQTLKKIGYHWHELTAPQSPEQPLKVETTISENGHQHHYELQLSPIFNRQQEVTGHLMLIHDISDRKEAEQERERLIEKLQDALAQVKTLSGLLPICASCKKIRSDDGYWVQVEEYIRQRSDANFTHGICPDCGEKWLTDMAVEKSDEE